MIDQPKLFVSYSHDGNEHEAWVYKLATDLRKLFGIDVVLDQWDLRIGDDLSLFMEHGLSNVALVLCICSDSYVIKANAGKGGSGYEKMIMTRALIKDTDIDYLIPVIRANTNAIKLPVFLSTKVYIDFSNDSEYECKLLELAKRIQGVDIKRKPPLGVNPFSSKTADLIDIQNLAVTSKYHNPQLSGKVVFNYSNNSSRFIIGTGEYEFVTSWSECGPDSIYAYKDSVKQIGYTSRRTDFPPYDDLRTFDYTSRARKVYSGEIVIWVNRYGHFAATKILDIKNKSRGAEEDELSFEYLIYN